LRAQLAAPPLVMPGAFDALSARLIERAGFGAVMAGGYSAAASLFAEPDAGQLTLNDYVDHYGRIAAAVSIPLFVDADTGFGGVSSVRRAVRAFSRAGIAGMFIEDQTTPKRCGYLSGKNVVPAEEMVAKIKAALDARLDDAFVVCARTDTWGILGPEEAIARAQRYRTAGADMTFVQGADSLDDMRRVCRDVGGLQLVNLSHASPRTKPTAADVAATGAAAVMYPSALLFASAGAMIHALNTFKRDGDFAKAEGPFPTSAALSEIVGLDAFLSREIATEGG
jgi:2-methylisocitrate lyase-like PEP mutase family enzyme